jgi:hypothetical protein
MAAVQVMNPNQHADPGPVSRAARIRRVGLNTASMIVPSHARMNPRVVRSSHGSRCGTVSLSCTPAVGSRTIRSMCTRAAQRTQSNSTGTR